MDNIEEKEKNLWLALEYLEIAQISAGMKDRIPDQEPFIEMCLKRAEDYYNKIKDELFLFKEFR